MEEQQQQTIQQSISLNQEKRPRSDTADELSDVDAKRPKLDDGAEASDVPDMLPDGCTAASEGECDEADEEPVEEGVCCFLYGGQGPYAPLLSIL